MKDQLKKLRKTLGLTQAALGKKIGMSDTSISHMEAGRVPINDQNVRIICLTFGVREAWLRTGEGDMIDEESDLSAYEKRILDIFRKLSPGAQNLFIKHGEELIFFEKMNKKQAEPSDKLDQEKGSNPIQD